MPLLGQQSLNMRFRYCECGCKGYASSTHWIFWDLMNKFDAYRGHGFSGVKLRTCSTRADAELACNNDVELARVIKCMQVST